MILVIIIIQLVFRRVCYSLISPHPNTYTFSKRLAEDVVSDYFPQLPVVIARPAIGTVSKTLHACTVFVFIITKRYRKTLVPARDVVAKTSRAFRWKWRVFMEIVIFLSRHSTVENFHTESTRKVTRMLCTQKNQVN